MVWDDSLGNPLQSTLVEAEDDAFPPVGDTVPRKEEAGLGLVRLDGWEEGHLQRLGDKPEIASQKATQDSQRLEYCCLLAPVLGVVLETFRIRASLSFQSQPMLLASDEYSRPQLSLLPWRRNRRGDNHRSANLSKLSSHPEGAVRTSPRSWVLRVPSALHSFDAFGALSSA